MVNPFDPALDWLDKVGINEIDSMLRIERNVELTPINVLHTKETQYTDRPFIV